MKMLDQFDALLRSKLFLRVLAVFLAFFVWFYAAGDRNLTTVKSLKVPLEYHNLKSGLSISSRESAVQIQVRGLRQRLGRFDPGQFACVVDLQGLDRGIYTLPVDAPLPAGIELVSVSPSYIKVQLSEIIEKNVPIEIEYPKNLPETIIVTKEELKKTEATIRGPAGTVEKIPYVFVAPDIEQLSATTDPQQLVLPLQIPVTASSATQLSIQPREVELNVQVKKRLPVRTVPLRVDVQGDPADDYRVKTVVIAPAEVTLSGPPEHLEQLESLSLDPVTIESLDHNRTLHRVIPVPEEGVRIVDAPREATVTVELAPVTETRLYAHVRVQPRGKGVYPHWTFSPERVDVVLQGRPSELDRVKDVAAFVDITNLVSRVITVPVHAKAGGASVDVQEIMPATVTAYADVK